MKKNNFHGVWCVPCRRKHPPTITAANYLVPVRKLSYQFLNGTVEIDKRLMGVCDNCLADKNKFQQDNKIDVDPENKHLVYKFN